MFKQASLWLLYSQFLASEVHVHLALEGHAKWGGGGRGGEVQHTSLSASCFMFCSPGEPGRSEELQDLSACEVQVQPWGWEALLSLRFPHWPTRGEAVNSLLNSPFSVS